jgi:hypothetical protein
MRGALRFDPPAGMTRTVGAVWKPDQILARLRSRGVGLTEEIFEKERVATEDPSTPFSGPPVIVNGST